MYALLAFLCFVWILRKRIFNFIRRIWYSRPFYWIIKAWWYLEILSAICSKLFGSHSFYPTEAEIRVALNGTFPFPEIPENQKQTLQEVLYITTKLNDGLVPILLPQDATDENFMLYDRLLTSLETRDDTTWLVLAEGDPINVCNGITSTFGRPKSRKEPTKPLLTSDEERLEEMYGIRARCERLKKWQEDLDGGEISYSHNRVQAEETEAVDEGKSFTKPDPWTTPFVEEILPPFQLGSDDSGTVNANTLVLTTAELEEAQTIYDDRMRRRDHVVSYCKLHGAEVFTWLLLPAEDEADAEVEVDGQKKDVQKKRQWKPLYLDWEMQFKALLSKDENGNYQVLSGKNGTDNNRQANQTVTIENSTDQIDISANRTDTIDSLIDHIGMPANQTETTETSLTRIDNPSNQTEVPKQKNPRNVRYLYKYEYLANWKRQVEAGKNEAEEGTGGIPAPAHQASLLDPPLESGDPALEVHDDGQEKPSEGHPSIMEDFWQDFRQHLTEVLEAAVEQEKEDD